MLLLLLLLQVGDREVNGSLLPEGLQGGNAAASSCTVKNTHSHMATGALHTDTEQQQQQLSSHIGPQLSVDVHNVG